MLLLRHARIRTTGSSWSHSFGRRQRFPTTRTSLISWFLWTTTTSSLASCWPASCCCSGLLASSSFNTFRSRNPVIGSRPRNPFSSAENSSCGTGTGNTIRTMSSSSSSFPTTWNDAKDEAIKKCVLPLSSSSHKGSSGRVGVLGGSARYTGAPYYAAMASLKVGADLAYVYCAEEASMPIKCYSPELMVSPIYSATEFDKYAKKQNENEDNEEIINTLIQSMVQEVVSMMDRMHVLVVGPGLGRCPLVMRATCEILREARDCNLSLVLDADALYLLTMEPYQNILEGYDKLVLTPNVVEHKRLVQAGVLSSNSDDDSNNNSNNAPLDSATVVQKGRHDVIVSPNAKLVCKEEGGLKRSGGLGDLLAGTLGTFLSWNQILSEEKQQQQKQSAKEQDLALACWSACCVVKRATKRAFDVKQRSMTAPDVLNVIGETVNEMTN